MRKGKVDGFVSTTEAARRLGMTPQAIWLKCAKGRIKGAVQLDRGGQWHVPLAWVEQAEKLLRAIYAARTAPTSNGSNR